MVFEEDRKPLKAVDWVIIAFYFVACILVGLWVCTLQQLLVFTSVTVLIGSSTSYHTLQQRLFDFCRGSRNVF